MGAKKFLLVHCQVFTWYRSACHREVGSFTARGTHRFMHCDNFCVGSHSSRWPKGRRGKVKELSVAVDIFSNSRTKFCTHLKLSRSVLSWLHSYLPNRQQFVILKTSSSCLSSANYSVPQGWSLALFLYHIFIACFGHIICHHGLWYHCYTDDTQLYLITTPTTLLFPCFLVRCLQEIENCIKMNALKLNSMKTAHGCRP